MITNGNTITASVALDAALAKLKTVIEGSMSPKKQCEIIKWLNIYSDYLSREAAFKPEDETLKYDAGTVLSVELGYNPGSEHGGNHFVVVIEDNGKKDGTVMVVPLGSCAPGQRVHRTEVDLGVIEEINDLSQYPLDTKTIAKISQMRSISKLRITAPVHTGQAKVVLGPDELRKIYAPIKRRFTTQGLNRASGVTKVYETPSASPTP